MKFKNRLIQAFACLCVFLSCFYSPAGAGAAQTTIPSRDKAMQIAVSANGVDVVYVLNDSTAARELYAQLPMTIEVENYGGIEKIFYPPKKLATSDTPLVKSAKNGTLAYYAPWGDVVMFYDRFGAASGLYELGHAISGAEHIRNLSGTIQIGIVTD